MKQFSDFKKKVKDEGSPLINIILNDDWFDSVIEDAKRVWTGDGTDPYQCRFFPYRWLCEENQWDFINNGLKIIDQFSKRKKLRSNLRRIISDRWMEAHATAFEMNALCKFANDGVLMDIEHKIVPDKGFNTDALIKIDQNNILVELTSITKNIVDSITSQAVTLSTQQLIDHLGKKIEEKAEPGKQLSFATQPSILIISLLPGFGADQFTAEWTMEKYLNVYPNINAYLISVTYLFQYGKCYFNDKAKFDLTKKEKDYLSKLLIPTTI